MFKDCGKIISYIIPILQRYINYTKQNPNYNSSIYALILLPARELAEQVYTEISKFITNMNNYKITSQLFIGGKKYEEDIKKYKLEELQARAVIDQSNHNKNPEDPKEKKRVKQLMKNRKKMGIKGKEIIFEKQ